MAGDASASRDGGKDDLVLEAKMRLRMTGRFAPSVLCAHSLVKLVALPVVDSADKAKRGPSMASPDEHSSPWTSFELP